MPAFERACEATPLAVYDQAMSVYMMITYDVSDPEGFAAYNPGSLKEIFSTVSKHGGAIVGAGPTDVVTGEAAQTCVCLTFPSADAGRAWLDDDDYAPLKAIRFGSTTNISEYIVPAL